MRGVTDVRAAAAAATHGVGAAAQGTVEGAARQASPWLTRGARLGYAAKGIVYITLGLIAVQAAMGSRAAAEDQRGALRTLGEQPAGQLLLGIVAVGLLCYAVWRVIAGIVDAERKGNEPKKLAVRAGMVGSGLLHGALGLYAFRLVQGAGERGSAGGERSVHWTARLMGMPAGRWLVGGVGLGIIGYGVRQIYRGWTADVRKHLDLTDVGAETQQWIVRLGRLGYAARGVVFAVIGTFLVRAALTYDPSQATGIGGALQALEQAPWGPWLLGLVALGLIAYGLFEIVEARYRVVRV
jgi:Domain of Unknown Function (DUF1206)